MVPVDVKQHSPGPHGESFRSLLAEKLQEHKESLRRWHRDVWGCLHNPVLYKIIMSIFFFFNL